MTAQEAYRILYIKLPFTQIRSCLDFGKFFAFNVVPINIKDDEYYYAGTILIAVDKQTGKVFEYDFTIDLDAYEQAKEVKVESVWDMHL